MPDLILSHTLNLGKIARHLEDCTEMERWELQQKLWAWLREKAHFVPKDSR